MTPLLGIRDLDAVELMDDPDCDARALMRTYAQFRMVNAVVAGWRHTYRTRLRPSFVSDTHSLLDIGTGGGDVARALVRWAERDGVTLTVTAIDPDPRALRFARRHGGGIDWRSSFSSELADAGETFDFVVSNHVLHHLDAAQLGTMLADSAALATRAVVHSDIRRSRAAYALFAVLTAPALVAPPSRRSFIRADGLTSIRRSYTPVELARLVPTGWSIAPQAPHRVLVLHAGRGADA
ncbi:class I SAM-dependent methyltransferase [Okibacterium endophyticum]